MRVSPRVRRALGGFLAGRRPAPDAGGFYPCWRWDRASELRPARPAGRRPTLRSIRPASQMLGYSGLVLYILRETGGCFWGAPRCAGLPDCDGGAREVVSEGELPDIMSREEAASWGWERSRCIYEAA